jgi:hypothetical protein
MYELSSLLVLNKPAINIAIRCKYFERSMMNSPRMLVGISPFPDLSPWQERHFLVLASNWIKDKNESSVIK